MRWNSDGTSGNLREAHEKHLNDDVNQPAWKVLFELSPVRKRTWGATCATVRSGVVVEGTGRAGVAQRTPSDAESTNHGARRTKNSSRCSCKSVSIVFVFTLRSSRGCRANTVVVQTGADKTLCCMAGTLLGTDTARGQSSTSTSGCLRENKHP